MTSNHCAVPVIVLEEEKKSSLFSNKIKTSYKLNAAGLTKILGQKDFIDKKVAVISIAGAFRKGKSFLLNFFVNYLEFLSNGGRGEWLNEETPLDKFHWRGGSKRDTNGIYLWSRPYLLEDKDGEEIVVLLMDTQGTFDHKTTINDCATIFALSTLISSVQIFNVSQQIQEDDFNNLRLFTEVAQMAQDENQKKTTAFQKLRFLIRDWPNSDEYGYGFEGGAEYLEKLLAIKPKQKKELQKLRTSLKNSFERIDAFLMPHPGLRVASNNSDKVLGKVEADFKEYLEQFVTSHFKENFVEPKTMHGETLTCRGLINLFGAYMKIFNSDKLPKVKTILEATAEVMLSVAETKAKQEYDTQMKEKMSNTINLTKIDVLNGFHSASVDAARKVFASRPKISGDLPVATIQQKLQTYFEERLVEHKRVVEQNLKVAEENERLEAEKARLEEEERIAKKKIKDEEDRLARLKAEQEEALRKEREENERKRRAEEERLRQQQLEQQRENERLRQERERIEADLRRAQQAAEAAERQREMASRAFFTSPAFYPSPSQSYRSYSSPPNIQPETYTSSRGNVFTRYRDMDTGRFTKNPYG
ncbi:unnamed protein product, partial [Mesorhabditis belari]|uniref:GB1/RHD3-type G domain-containing protein n=1 Tax=Mesorhabditis belari TaxID=2138241 RepID=A0AAF3FGH8_9BILA